MPVVDCPACGRAVSVEAARCPRCDQPFGPGDLAQRRRRRGLQAEEDRESVLHVTRVVVSATVVVGGILLVLVLGAWVWTRVSQRVETERALERARAEHLRPEAEAAP